MTDQEWNRICKRASITHTLAIAALVMGPCAVWALAPEFVAQFTAMLSASPYGEGIEAALICACVAGIIFDGPKSWERRYSQSNTGEIARR